MSKYIEVGIEEESMVLSELIDMVDYKLDYDWKTTLTNDYGYIKELQDTLDDYDNECMSKSAFRKAIRGFFKKYNIHEVDIYTHSASCIRSSKEIKLPSNYSANGYFDYLDDLLTSSVVVTLKEDIGGVDELQRLYNCIEGGEIYYVNIMEETTCGCCNHTSKEVVESIGMIIDEDIEKNYKTYVEDYFGEDLDDLKVVFSWEN